MLAAEKLTRVMMLGEICHLHDQRQLLHESRLDVPQQQWDCALPNTLKRHFVWRKLYTCNLENHVSAALQQHSEDFSGLLLAASHDQSYTVASYLHLAGL
jgi:hypothetical protein